MATNPQFDNSGVSPVYMSQTEANEVMELWAMRQREDAERQAMVTVHDVAEAIQLSPQEVQRLLQDLRTSKDTVQTSRSQPSKPTTQVREQDIPWGAAILKVLPLTVAFALGMALYVSNHYYASIEQLRPYPILWVMGVGLFYAVRAILRLWKDAHLGREVQKRIGRPSQLAVKPYRIDR